MDCLIHVGLHKTATTSFQNFLFNETILLTSLGIIYPRSILDLSLKQHSVLPDLFLKKQKNSNSKSEIDISNYIEKLENEIKNSKMKLCILSSEVFTELNSKDKASTKIIINYLKRIFNKVTLFISTRDIKERALSMYKHKIRLASVEESFHREFFESPKLFKNKVKGTKLDILGWENHKIEIIMKNMSEEKFPIESYLKAIINLLDKNNVNTFNAYIKKNENFFADKNILMNKNSYKPISYLFTSVLGLYLFNAENKLKEKICFGKINSFIHDLDDQIKEIIFTITDENLIKFLSLETKFRIKDSNIMDILIKSDISYSASFIIRKYVNIYINELIMI